MSTIQALDFAVKQGQLHQTKFITKTYSENLASNQVLFEIESFSLTSNNITYAVMGEKMNYWKFFPCQTGYGIIPAWGFAKVVHSSHPEMKVGQRFYGYYPMSTHLLVHVDKVGSLGFIDVSEHRKTLPKIYNYYTNVALDPAITPKTEELIAILRPLFATSFLIDDFLAEKEFFHSSQIILTSASSKTAQALACLLAHRKKEKEQDFQVIGLTGSRNADFVKDLGHYDQVLSYDSIAELDADKKSVVVDFTGNHQTQFDLQVHLNQNLAYNCLVGLVDWQNHRGKEPLPKRGELFFAPTHAEKRQKEWGLPGFHEKLGIAWQIFLEAIQSSILIRNCQGRDALQKLYLDMLNGQINPSHGDMVSLGKAP